MKNILKHILNKKVFYVFLILMGCVLLSACEIKIDNDINQTDAEMRSIRGCWSCQVFGTVYKAAGKITELAYENMRSVALNFLAVFLALWIAYKTLSFFMSFRVPNYTEYWVSLTGRIMRAIFAAAILANTQVMMKFVNMIVEPVILLFVYLSMRIIGANDQAFAVGSNVNVGTAFADNPALPAAVGTQLENLIYRIQVALDLRRGLYHRRKRLYRRVRPAAICLATANLRDQLSGAVHLICKLALYIHSTDPYMRQHTACNQQK